MSNRPMHEILAAAWPHLYYLDTRPEGEYYLCYALDEAEHAGVITCNECMSGQTYLRDAVHSINPHVAFLRSAAIEAELLLVEYTVSTPQYVEFRDRWFTELIERAKHEQLPESPTPRNEST